MFKKNENFKQKNLFSIPNSLNKQQQKLWYSSREHTFFNEVFSKIDEELFKPLYSDVKSRPNVPVNQLIGSLILKHLNNWTYSELFANLNFNSLTRHAIGIDSLNDSVFSEASIFNFQNKVISHFRKTEKDLISEVFKQLTLSQLKEFDIDSSIQRGDSFLVGSNIVDYSRLQLLIEIIIRLSRILAEDDLSKLDEYIKPYSGQSSSNYIYRLEKKDLPKELEQLSNIYLKIKNIICGKYEGQVEYHNFKRVFEEHFTLVDKQIGAKDPKELHSSILMSPDDLRATYRDKRSQTSKGYVGHISETVNKKNKINLITDVIVEPNNIGDAEILENRLPHMISFTPDFQEYFVDGQYGSPEVDLITNKHNITIYQRAIRGRKSNGKVMIQGKHGDQYKVTCGGGQEIISEFSTQRNGKPPKRKAVFDGEICKNCPLNKICNLSLVGGKKTIEKRIYYFGEKQILSHKRFLNISKLSKEKKNFRANVEASVKEMKRGMKNGKVRIRQWRRISLHMILTAIAINLTRIAKESFNLMLEYYMKLHRASWSVI